MKTGWAVICFLFILSCGKISGEFAFKTEFDDIFRKPLRMPEIDTNQKTEWVYSFNSDFARRDIYVIIMKKEVTWIEIAAYKDFAGGGKMTVGGVIEGYEAGQYRILLIDSIRNNEIDDIVFVVYFENDFEDDEKY